MYIVIAMVLGIVTGYLIHANCSPAFIKSFAPKIKLLATIFLRLVQMIIAPLFLPRSLWASPNWET